MAEKDEKELRWGCGDCTPDNPAFVPEDVDQVLVSAERCYCMDDWGQDCGSWCDTAGFSVAKLKDGRIGVSRESSDSTGHG